MLGNSGLTSHGAARQNCCRLGATFSSPLLVVTAAKQQENGACMSTQIMEITAGSSGSGILIWHSLSTVSSDLQKGSGKIGRDDQMRFRFKFFVSFFPPGALHPNLTRLLGSLRDNPLSFALIPALFSISPPLNNITQAWILSILKASSRLFASLNLRLLNGPNSA